MHGMFDRNTLELVGVCQWIPPTKPAALTVNKENWTRVLSLSRLCIKPNILTNGASFLMGRSIRLIKQEGKWVSLVTYADEFMNHTGQVYKACNWEYIGLMGSNPRWEDKDGRQVSILSTKTRSVDTMKKLGYVMVGKFKKHKFVLHLPVKKIHKNTINQLFN
jgi:hypothetical protein